MPSAAVRSLARIPDSSRDYHTKGQQIVRLSDDGRASLRALASFYGIGMSAVIEMLTRERVHDLKLSVSRFLKPDAPKRGRGR